MGGISLRVFPACVVLGLGPSCMILINMPHTQSRWELAVKWEHAGKYFSERCLAL